MVHTVKPRLSFREPLRGADGAAGEGVAAVGAMNEFEAFADAAEDHRVLADVI